MLIVQTKKALHTHKITNIKYKKKKYNNPLFLYSLVHQTQTKKQSI